MFFVCLFGLSHYVANKIHILTLFEVPNLLSAPDENIFNAQLAGKRKFFIESTLFNMYQSFKGLVSQQAPI